MCAGEELRIANSLLSLSVDCAGWYVPPTDHTWVVPKLPGPMLRAEIVKSAEVGEGRGGYWNKFSCRTRVNFGWPNPTLVPEVGGFIVTHAAPPEVDEEPTRTFSLALTSA